MRPMTFPVVPARGLFPCEIACCIWDADLGRQKLHRVPILLLFFLIIFLKPVSMASKLEAGQYSRQPGWQLCGKGGRRQQSISVAAFLWSNGVCCSGPCHPPGCLANQLALFCSSGLVCTANGESYRGATHHKSFWMQVSLEPWKKPVLSCWQVAGSRQWWVVAVRVVLLVLLEVF